MDKIAAYEMLLSEHPLYSEKVAFSTSKLLPVGTALGGSVLGGAGGAMSTKDPAERKKRALMGAAVGGLTGGLGGEVLRRGAIAKSLRSRVADLDFLNKDLDFMNSALERHLDEVTAKHESTVKNLSKDLSRARSDAESLERQLKDARAISAYHEAEGRAISGMDSRAYNKRSYEIRESMPGKKKYRREDYIPYYLDPEVLSYLQQYGR